MEALKDWLLDPGIKILIIIVLAFVVDRVIDSFADQAIKKYVEKKQEDRDQEEIEQRAETLAEVFNKTTSILIIIVAVMMILAEIEINIGPVLAGAGVIGLAIGFGAQNLVRDFLAGLFVIIEDQYAKGDLVQLGEVKGIVEQINLRRTVVRDIDGGEHHVPNGEIKIATNLSKDWSRVNLDVAVSYESDAEKVTEVLNRVGRELAQDKDFKHDILEPPEVLGLDQFGPSELIFKFLGKTKPLRQAPVARELRKRIKAAFDKEGIEIPYPHRKIIQVKEKK